MASEELTEPLRDRHLRPLCGRVGGPGAPGVDVVAEVAATDFLEGGDRAVLHGRIGILEGFSEDRDRGGIAEFAEHPQGAEADVEIGVGPVPRGEEDDGVRSAARPPDLAGADPHPLVGILQRPAADRGGAGGVEGGGLGDDLAAHPGIMLLEDAAREVLRESQLAIGAGSAGCAGLLADRLDPLVGGRAVPFGEPGCLFPVAPRPVELLPGASARAAARRGQQEHRDEYTEQGAAPAGGAVGAVLWQRSRHGGRIVPMERCGDGDRTGDLPVEPDQSRFWWRGVGHPAGGGALGKTWCLWGSGLVVLVAVAAPARGPETVDDPPRERVRLLVRSDEGPRPVEGELLVEAADGGALVESADGRLELVQPDVIAARDTLDTPPEPLAARDLAKRVLAELPAGFDVVITKHYVVCYDTSRGYAQWCASLFERLHDAFVNFWRQAGLDLAGPQRPLVVVVFADRERYEAFAAGDLGAAADRVVGYYNLLSNRVTTFDLTGRDGPGGRGGSAGRAGLEILASPEATGLVSTLIHEATHQMAFNSGLHRRLAPVPLWVSEGVAAYFETPDLASGRGWRGIGGVNRPRAERFLASARPGRLGPIVTDDGSFRHPDTALDAYAGGWALTAFLIQTRKADYVRYLEIIAAKPPLAEDSAEQRRADFVAAFGAEPEAFEDPLARFVARLR